jgi:hypothetical protein
VYFSKISSSFRGRKLPEEGEVTCYAEIIENHDLPVQVPDQIAIISLS